MSAEVIIASIIVYAFLRFNAPMYDMRSPEVWMLSARRRSAYCFIGSLALLCIAWLLDFQAFLEFFLALSLLFLFANICLGIFTWFELKQNTGKYKKK